VGVTETPGAAQATGEAQTPGAAQATGEAQTPGAAQATGEAQTPGAADAPVTPGTGPDSAPVSVFDEATAARPLGGGRYAVRPDERFTMGGAVNGGVLIASLLRAVLDRSPHPYPVATSAHFLRVARCEPAEVHVTWLKEGRTAATARATLVQDAMPVIETVVTTGDLETSDAAAGLSWTGEPPHLPPTADCRGLAPTRRFSGFTSHVDIRLDPATLGWLDGRPGGTPEMRGYLGLRPSRDPDAYLLALAVDALPPVVFGLGAAGWAPTVELTWHMRGVPVPGLLRVAARGRRVSGGWFDEEAEVWDAAGHLVAQSRQLARLGRAAAPQESGRAAPPG
jgi:Acyl-CoA thioesterase C-terminal domain/Acyl-CoA thioesterase N-terminal domain